MILFFFSASVQLSVHQREVHRLQIENSKVKEQQQHLLDATQRELRETRAELMDLRRNASSRHQLIQDERNKLKVVSHHLSEHSFFFSNVMCDFCVLHECIGNGIVQW